MVNKMVNKKADSEMIDELYSLIVSLDNKDDCKALFEDLCTFKEIEQMAQRIKAAKLLLQGYTFNQITDEVDISSATLSRVSRCVRYGSGYKNILK